MTDKSLHKRLLDHLRSAVLMVGKDDRQELVIRYLNPSAEMLLQTSDTKAIGRPLADICFNEDEIKAMEEAMEQIHPFTCREAVLPVAPGHAITVDYSVTPLLEPGASTTLLIEMEPLDRLLRISREEALIHAHQATRALVRGVAHELKNPLGGIRGAAQLLERALPDEELAEYTHVIIEEADRLRNLADRMLGPRKLPVYESVNIHECLERVRALLLAENPDQVVFERDYDISLPDISADKDQLVQVLLNISRNAMQALIEAKIPRPRIVFRTRVLRQFTIGALRHKLVLVVEVEDNGPGVPEDIQETLFYPMVSGRANGSGLGLSIAQSIINQHQGLIECDSEPGKTVFSVLLPVERQEVEPENTGIVEEITGR